MMIATVPQALVWVAALCSFMGVAVAVALLTARSLFSVGIGLAAFSACMSGALAALGHGDGAVALAFIGGAIIPVLFLAGVLLTSRAVKPRKRGAPWLSIAAGGAAACAMLWAAPSLSASETSVTPATAPPIALAALVFVAVIVSVGLLGYGERGVLGGARQDRGS